jgi:hypothetical protein
VIVGFLLGDADLLPRWWAFVLLVLGGRGLGVPGRDPFGVSVGVSAHRISESVIHQRF